MVPKPQQSVWGVDMQLPAANSGVFYFLLTRCRYQWLLAVGEGGTQETFEGDGALIMVMVLQVYICVKIQNQIAQLKHMCHYMLIVQKSYITHSALFQSKNMYHFCL